MTGVMLSELLSAGLCQRVVGDASVRVAGVQHDSRKVLAGDLFVAIPGANHDGIRFARDAVGRGAAAVLAEGGSEVEASLEVPIVWAAKAREALGPVASLVYGRPTAPVVVPNCC